MSAVDDGSNSSSLLRFSDLTPTVKQQIVDQVSIYLVKELCHSMTGSNSDLANSLVATVTDMIGKIFENQELDAKNKLSYTILGGLQNAIRPIQGSSLLTYSILKTPQGRVMYSELIKRVFERAKKDTNDGDGYLENFVRNVISVLNVQPPELFIATPGQLGGKRTTTRNRTLRKYRKQWTATQSRRSIQKGGIGENWKIFETPAQTQARKAEEDRQAKELNTKVDENRQRVTTADDTVSALTNGNGDKAKLADLANKSDLHKEVFTHPYATLSNTQLDGRIKTPEEGDDVASLQAHKNARQQLEAQEAAERRVANTFVIDNQKSADLAGKTGNLLKRGLNKFSLPFSSKQTAKDAVANVKTQQDIVDLQKKIQEDTAKHNGNLTAIRTGIASGAISPSDGADQLAKATEDHTVNAALLNERLAQAKLTVKPTTKLGKMKRFLLPIDTLNKMKANRARNVSNRIQTQKKIADSTKSLVNASMASGSSDPSQMSPPAQSIINDFGADLLKSVSTRLGVMEDMILRKILDAIYYQLEHNPNPIMQSIVNIMTSQTVTDGLNGASTKILLCSCLFNDAVLFGSTLTDTYNNNNKNKPLAQPALIDYIQSDSFINTFTDNFIKKVNEKVF